MASKSTATAGESPTQIPNGPFIRDYLRVDDFTEVIRQDSGSALLPFDLIEGDPPPSLEVLLDADGLGPGHLPL